MTTQRKFLVSLLFFICSLTVNGQDNNLKLADQYFNKSDFEKAATYYKKVNKQGSIKLSLYYDSYVTS